MTEIKSIKHIIKRVWREPECTLLLSSQVDTTLYSELSKEIPDKYLAIEEVFCDEELDDIWESFKGYLSEYEVFPFLGLFGGAVICVGYGENNIGKIFYFDFDFGCLQFDSDDLNQFISKLKYIEA
ncbi:SMI1/KNR4 family protein [Pseudoalteromonas aliena]|uniref:SMI1/KNR4 family protein n=1 Tax=Pseudoalteromonas aliena TaxID=247523 RepID=UPI0024941ED6|nr:SMI1/KNR4 family protein [Pseudoalteromonas aliena]